MIPLRDDIPSRTTPLVNYLIIAICTIAFLAQVASVDSGNTIVQRFGMVPLRLSEPNKEIVVPQAEVVSTPFGPRQVITEKVLPPPAVPAWATILTCMFLHGGWMHFLGNMWFLYIFGDNVEDRLGPLGYAIAYLGTGVAAGLAHYFADPSSPVPTIGASGAIAGVMGAYAFLYPHARVLAVLPIFIFIQTFVVPAPVFLGIWFLLQTFSGIGSTMGGQAGGVAWWAHVGGFVAGGLVALVVGRSPLAHDAVTERRF
ncbi:rhomboid family intramembrane serine protease [Crateriforma conspicua]|uniref:Rhomboid family protein n=1 Tax=Crateriforma conspicua TaxID=2527996 RepID=A0A5C5Y1N1_9PLAN|nr:rhomboid family intramembrane serine protease [Crateriforma conspicua]QDV64273.1 Rhomboid family protein [Crateriforma conspicua]TWT69666.1 Rhomboid family protein [Crateriforma conspicua]